MAFRERSALRGASVSHCPTDEARLGAGEGGTSRPRPAPEAQLSLGNGEREDKQDLTVTLRLSVTRPCSQRKCPAVLDVTGHPE